MAGVCGAEYVSKEKRMLAALESGSHDLAVIGRGSNFTWLTSGGNWQVASSCEFGPAVLLIGPERRQLIANTMDGHRILEEELTGLDFELVDLPWYSSSPHAKALELSGKAKAVADMRFGSHLEDPDFFVRLHYPLSKLEISRYRELAGQAEQILLDTAGWVKPGVTERAIAQYMMGRYADSGMDAPVLIIGSDERIAKYRHCLPSDKRVKNTLLLAPAPRKWGLCCPISRMVSFGSAPSAELKRSFDALLAIEAATFSGCKPGSAFTGILDTQKALFAKHGYPEEWQKHFQGGMTGYIINDPTKCTNPAARVVEGQAFNWYITITGAKVEETVISRNGMAPEIISATGIWPLRSCTYDKDTFMLPEVLVR